MQLSLLKFLRCPVTRSSLQIEVISTRKKVYNNVEEEIIFEGLLFAQEDWFYPIVKGIPRLIVEAFLDYEVFFREHLKDFDKRKWVLEKKYHGLIQYVVRKNKRTKESFAQEWSIFNYHADKTWDMRGDELVTRFLTEIGEDSQALHHKLIFDAGCGNGLLNQLLAKDGGTILGMDFSLSIERAFENNSERSAWFIQGDVQFPPVPFGLFDVVHSSGVLICTNNTELSFSCLTPCVKPGGKLSVWLYHPRKNFLHNLFNFIRRFTSRLPLKLQYYLYLVTLFPVSFIIKRIKGNKQNSREMMIDILDWFTPEFRWEHEHDEAASWFCKRNYEMVTVTTSGLFGFNIIGTKKTGTDADRYIRNESF